MSRLLIVILLSFSSLVFAKPNELVVANKGDVFYDFTVAMYEDSSASLSFKQIQEIKDFTPQSNHISKGYSQSFLWFKFTIKNATNLALNYFIKFTESITHEVDCYIQSSNGEYIKYEQGVGYFSKNKVNELKKPEFKFNLNSSESKTIYLRISGIYPNFTSFYLFDEKALNNYILKYDILYSLFFGAVLALLLYNVVIYFFSREISYLYYVLYVSTFLSWQLLLNGFFPFNTFNSTSSYYLSAISIPLLMSFGIFFSRSILNTNNLFPKIDRIIKTIAVFYILLAFTLLFFMQQSLLFINLLAIFIVPLLLYIGFQSYLKGNTTALFYIIAQITFLSMSVLFSLMAAGFLEYSLLTRHGFIVGFFIEIILFSLALAYRIRVLQNEKFLLINQANTELDEKVKERTKELEQSREVLKLLATTDSLTGLSNRRALLEVGDKLIRIAKRENSPLSLIMFDLDKFKSINDIYGHAIGDIVIKTFSLLLQETRKSDIAARIGGEEFVLLLPNTNKLNAFEIASQIRKDTEKLKIQVDKNNFLNFTTSGGVDTLVLDDDSGSDFNQLLSRADKALYNAKKSGRNQIM
ncbi:MAG: diguanylate cyclase [Pseudomonadota bacterium]